VDDQVVVDGELVPIGAMMLDHKPDPDPELDALGEWRMSDGAPWSLTWHRHLVLLTRFKAESGTRAELLTGHRMYFKVDLGTWLCKQHVGWNKPLPKQREALARLRMQPVTSGQARCAVVPWPGAAGKSGWPSSLRPPGSTSRRPDRWSARTGAGASPTATSP
jgi:hypothetical protein